MTHTLTINYSLVFENLFCYIAMSLFWIAVTYIWSQFIPYKQDTNLLFSTKEKRHWSQSYNYYFRYTCMLHSTFLVIMGVYSLYENGLTFGVPPSELGIFVAKLSLCFYPVDLARKEYFRDIDNAVRIHHVVVISLTMACLFPVAYTHELFFANLIGEASAPFRLLRDLVKFHGKEGSKLHKDLGFGFAFSFIISRIILAPMSFERLYRSIDSMIITILFSLIAFYSWHQMFILINWCAKMMQEDSELSKGIVTKTYRGMIHQSLNRARKNNVFLGVYYLFGGMFSFAPVLVVKTSWKLPLFSSMF